MGIKIIRTEKESSLRLDQTEEVVNQTSSTNRLILNLMDKRQSIIGFGGAFTESAGYTLSRMSKANRQLALESYFHPEKGIGYSLGRIHMNSCDFSLGNYTYIQEWDTDLSTFSMKHEEEWVIPMVKDAELIRGESIRLLMSPWSPPAFMKTNGQMNQGGKLLPEYAALWAKYYARFAKECGHYGLNIWATTVQNEPAAVQTWDSCEYSAEEERDFVKNHLGPTLEAEGLEDLKIIIWDHNRDIMLKRVTPILEDADAAKYVWGSGLHWYVSEDFEQVGEVHHRFPDKHLLFTEGCQEGGVHLGSWETGERYARNMMGDFNHYVEGYLDWNLVLDEMGGPNHVGNYCDAPIIADTKTNQLHFNSSYYYIGHFSKYIQPNAVNIGYEWHGNSCLSASFLNPNGDIIVIIMNDQAISHDISIHWESNAHQLQLAPHSIVTAIIPK